MQTTLRIDDAVFRAAKAEAARLGITLTRFIEEALRQRVARAGAPDAVAAAEVEERDRLMEALLRRTARFRVGRKPTRDEVNAR
jgi:antitoxin component of RelBE/YafQ-DinJ toxin-antitoxin module